MTIDIVFSFLKMAMTLLGIIKRNTNNIHNINFHRFGKIGLIELLLKTDFLAYYYFFCYNFMS